MKQPRIGNLREYLAGTGATGALIAGAIIAFLAVGALVAFDGSQLGGGGADGSVSLAEGPGSQAPEAAAAALGVTPGAVAARPAGGTVLAAILPGGIPVGPGLNGGGSTGTGPGGGDAPGTPTDPGSSGALSGLVGDVDETTGGLPPLSPTTGPVTDQIDDTVNDTLNNVGGALGQPNLGDNLNDTVRNLGNGLVGREGLTGTLLGGN
jgi:hypothetical protein